MSLLLLLLQLLRLLLLGLLRLLSLGLLSLLRVPVPLPLSHIGVAELRQLPSPKVLK